MTPRHALAFLLASTASGLARLAVRLVRPDGDRRAEAKGKHRVPVEPCATSAVGEQRGRGGQHGAAVGADDARGGVAAVFIEGVGHVVVSVSPQATSVVRGGVA